ncbi:MAG TPA: radical SAM protein [Nannocystis sp.]
MTASTIPPDLIPFFTMPLTFSSLVVESTNRCNARCGMCYQSAGPKGSDWAGKRSLSVPEIEKVLREAVQIPSLNRRFHLSGGEAFLDIEGTVHLFEVAAEAGFLDITAVTNAFWARPAARARALTRRIRAAGVTSLEISWTYWHSQHVAAEAVSNALEACRDAGIETNLRVLTTRSHSIEEALSLLRPEAAECATRITSGPVFATGRAAVELDPADLWQTRGSLDESCHSVLNLTVNALGNVFPCCAGIDQTDTFLFGNIRELSIVDIAERMNRSPVVRLIVFRGIRSLVPILTEAGIDIGDNFNNICHMCWSIFSRKENAQAIDAWFERAALRNIERVVRLLESEAAEAPEEVPEHV